MRKLTMLYFSATGTTKKIVKTLAEPILAEERQSIDFTSKKVRESVFSISEADLVIIGSPVYYGRIPAEVSDYLGRFKGSNTPAVLVVVYGNREYEDALLELYDLACNAGFIPVACAAFIGEHSYSSDKLPMAQGRPDQTDLEKARKFGLIIQERLTELLDYENNHEISLPGSKDYKTKTMPNYPLAPDTLKDVCNLCEICLDLCPVEAITLDDQANLKTDIGQCILCFACVKLCPLNARAVNNMFWDQGMEMLHKQCLERKEPEVYF